MNTDETFAMTAKVEPDDGGSVLRLEATDPSTIPYFWWAFEGQIRRALRDRLKHTARIFEAAAQGAPAPPEPKRPWWAPPESMTTDQVRVIATLSFLLAVVTYGGSLLTQTVDYVARTYDATNAQLGVVTAVTRVGTILALVGGALADRMGRRRMLLGSVALVSIATLASAAAPSLAAFGAFQVLVRGGTNLAFVVAFIAAVEEAPEAARTFTLAIVGIASTLGFVLGALLLPTADIAPDAWRGMYALGGLGLVFLPGVSGRLTETRRFEALVARAAPRGRLREVVDRRYGSRFFLMCATGFLLNLCFAPESQFLNRYLGDERGFTGLGILILRATTQAVPALIAAYIGGKLAETTGRRPIAISGLTITAFATAATFSFGGPVLWLMLGVATASGALASPSVSAFGTELFPTEVRGTAGAGLTLTAVLGSVTGLLLVGYLAEPLGSVGYAVAVTTAGPLFVAVFLIRLLPEARGQLLDDVSPSEV